MPVSIAFQHDPLHGSPIAKRHPKLVPDPNAPTTQELNRPNGSAYASATNDELHRWYQSSSGKFAILPLKVLSDKGLKLTALRVLTALAKYADPSNGICPVDTNAPTLDSLAALTGMHRVNVSKATGNLERIGWLKKTRQGAGRPTLFTLTIPRGPEQDGSAVWNPLAYGLSCFVPVEIAGDSHLTLEAMRVFLALSAHAKKDGTCFPGRSRTSNLTGMHVNNVSDATRKLEEAGWLTRVHRYLRSNAYTLTVPKPTGKEKVPSSPRGFEDIYAFSGDHYQALEYLRTPSPDENRLED